MPPREHGDARCFRAAPVRVAAPITYRVHSNRESSNVLDVIAPAHPARQCPIRLNPPSWFMKPQFEILTRTEQYQGPTTGEQFTARPPATWTATASSLISSVWPRRSPTATLAATRRLSLPTNWSKLPALRTLGSARRPTVAEWPPSAF